MKKLLAFILAFAMCLSLCACKNTTEDETTTQAVGQSEVVDSTEAVIETTTEETTTEHTHEWKEKTCSNPKTCETCGATEGSPADHRWKDATCTEPKKCSSCGETEGSANGHSWIDATCSEPKKCSVCGETEGSASGHKLKSDGTCSICGGNISAEEYSYHAGNDFRRVRREYSSAVGNGAYVIKYTSSNGDVCVITYVSYKIVNNYSVTTLHNLTTGETITEPFDYYNKLADRYVGASKIAYMNKASEARQQELLAMRGLSDALSTGSHSGAGAYVSAATLNL